MEANSERIGTILYIIWYGMTWSGIHPTASCSLGEYSTTEPLMWLGGIGTNFNELVKGLSYRWVQGKI